MAAAEVELKSPFVHPLCKGGVFSMEFLPLFGKEGKGRFSDGITRALYRNLRDSTLA